MKKVPYERVLIRNKSTKLIQTGNLIELTNKLINEDIEDLFNRAFRKMISDDHLIDEKENFLKIIML